MKKYFIYIFCIVILAASAPRIILPVAAINIIAPTPRATSVITTPMQEALWISPAVPPKLVDLARTWSIATTNNSILATNKLDVAKDSPGALWIYALTAPFATVTDDVTFQDLLATWKGVPTGSFSGHGFLMAESTLEAFTTLWGEPASGAVTIAPSDELMDLAWNTSAWAIIPFEDIQPKWKVLAVDGQSPIHKNFDAGVYPLKINFGLSNLIASALPESNRDASKLTTVILTGVTALVRATAVTMEIKGMTYPGSLIGDWLREADVTHISNEVTLDKNCPVPSASYTNFILCSEPKYLELFLSVGADVIELSGDHLMDRGANALLDTLSLYKNNNLLFYGGGINANDAKQPLLMEVNGNKIALMGCNGKKNYPKASDTSPGPANCDYDFFVKQIKEVKAQGYMVIFTFQHEECYFSGPCYSQEEGFRKVADAGAIIVSGSQAHFPHIMEFRGDSFIHYGLGNLFFDQMTYILPDGKVIDGTRREFLDRHVFYDGRYLGTELLTAMLEDYSRPRPMTKPERASFLTEYFYLSGWTPFTSPPILQPTVTLTPIALP
ncbi:MAG: CapA family protein [Chloroflexi bacterium]|nr:CapA family protein [Chloroflexota bacterium]